MAKHAQHLVDLATSLLDQGQFEGESGFTTKKQLFEADVAPSMRPLLAAIVFGVQEKAQLLKAVAKANGLYDTIPPDCLPLNENMLLVLLYEALLGSRRVRGLVPLAKFVQSRKSSLQQTLAGLRKQGSAQAFVAKVYLPRYARVNALLWDAARCQAQFLRKGYALLPRPLLEHAARPNFIGVAHRAMAWDPLVPDLLVLPPRTNLHNDNSVSEGKLILQDRSSCLSALALDPPPNSHVIDACAAPGNKTSHIAALLAGGGKVFAFERSRSRFDTLSLQMQKFGARQVQVLLHDFGQADHADPKFKEVTHILVDPTCSGSGLVSVQQQRVGTADLDHEPIENEEEQATLETLARDQVALVVHAMGFPQARCVVYSTCSVHDIENEEVVERVLATVNGDTRAGAWSVVRALPDWPHRGRPTGTGTGTRWAERCVRASHTEDNTNGFFVCRFEKRIETTQTPANLADETRQDQATNADEVSIACAPPKGISKKKRKPRRQPGTSETIVLHNPSKKNAQPVGSQANVATLEPPSKKRRQAQMSNWEKMQQARRHQQFKGKHQSAQSMPPAEPTAEACKAGQKPQSARKKPKTIRR